MSITHKSARGNFIAKAAEIDFAVVWNGKGHSAAENTGHACPLPIHNAGRFMSLVSVLCVHYHEIHNPRSPIPATVTCKYNK